MKKTLSLIALFIGGLAVSNAQTMEVCSPDMSQKIEITADDSKGVMEISYRTFFNGEPVILPSRMDLTFENKVWENALAKFYPETDKWFDDLSLTGTEETSHDSTWHNKYGERSTVKDAYNGRILHFAKENGYRLDIEVRAYNEGVAFRYSLPMHPEAIYHRLTSENTEYSFPEGTKAWFTSWAQGPYTFEPLKDWKGESERPVTLQLKDNLWVALGEAGVVDFPRGKYTLSAEKENTLVAALNDNGTDLVTPYSMPWRVIMAAERVGKLLENNDIFLNLNEPSRIINESWVIPGKIMRETTMTTANALAVIDFCAAHNMQYMLFDAGWYGNVTDFGSDAAKVISKLDMPKIVAYGKEKGVGIWLYINQHSLQTKAEKLFPMFKEWGIVGLKFGFVQFTSQHWADWVHRMVRLAAENDLMVNIHDEYRPTGYSRTYPNLMTQEGIRGNEEFPAAGHDTVLPFTRGLCGAGDYTVCYFDPRLKNTHGHQLALPVIFFSPLQTLYWYDYPARIHEVEELEFFDNVPVVWDDTKVIDENIGKHIAIARRSGNEWFVGVLGGDEAVSIAVATDYLNEGETYLMRVYNDDDTVDSPTKVRTSRYLVKGGAEIKLNLHAKGGAAIHFSPASKSDMKEYKFLKNKTL